MENLEGLSSVKIASTIKQELSQASIKIVQIPMLQPRQRGIIETNLIGVLNDFIFYRSYYFWTMLGNIQLYQVNDFLNLEENTIRIEGNWEGWTQGDFLKENPYADKVTYLEIDSQTALNAVADFLIVSSVFNNS